MPILLCRMLDWCNIKTRTKVYKLHRRMLTCRSYSDEHFICNHSNIRALDEMATNRIKTTSMEIGRNGILEAVGWCSCKINLTGSCLILKIMMTSREGSSSSCGSFTN